VRAVIRADASLDIGTGQVMRCLTLAELLRSRGTRVAFICREYEGNLCDLIEERGFSVRRLPRCLQPVVWQEDVAQSVAALRALDSHHDLIVVDHYQLDFHWEREMRAYTARIFVIDDLADRAHDCDLLLDQNLHDAPKTRYQRLVGPRTRVFVGPRFALLRPEFERLVAVPRDHGLRRLLIFLGSDRANETIKIVEALGNLGSERPQATLVLGPHQPHAPEIREAARDLSSLVVLASTGEMAKLIIDADLGVGTCGVAAWERCLLGLPALVVVTADNQRDDARILQSLGAVRNLGDAREVTVQMWSQEIRALQGDSGAIARMSRAATEIMFGRREAMAELENALTG
jgi:UDP-2,4-diacetamido-2,4,6-trideoxy-beta-L-altropyranose hydrolase